VHTIISVLLGVERRGDVSEEEDKNQLGHSRVDAALRQGEEEVEICVYARGEDDDVDDLFAEVVSR